MDPPTRPPARPTPTSRCGCSGSTARRRRLVGPRSATLPRHVEWTEAELVVLVQSRDQRSTRCWRVDTATGETAVIASRTRTSGSSSCPASRRVLADGRLVMTGDERGTRRLLVGGESVTPIELEVRGVDVADGRQHVSRPTRVDDATNSRCGAARRATHGGGHHAGRPHRRGGRRDDRDPHRHPRPSGQPGRHDRAPVRSSFAEAPLVTPASRLASRSAPLATRCCSPTVTTDRNFPVLLDPYGGPHALRVLRSHERLAYLAVVRRPGLRRGRRRRARHARPGLDVGADRAPRPRRPVLDDQVDALHAAAAEHPPSSTWTGSRSAGWSFGGYLAALAVLRRPDVFHAADRRGARHRLAPLRHALHRALPRASRRAADGVRPQLLIRRSPRDLDAPAAAVHGLADDNVVAAHTLRLSSALLAAGRPHEVLPLSGSAT